jgi:hypothetical protein
MKHFKYIIFIIFGILLFLLLSTINTFSIGNQFLLDRIGNGVVPGSDPLGYSVDSLIGIEPKEVLKRMYDIILSEEINICSLDGFGECYLTMHAGGGSCQINSMIGLYNIALGIDFDQEDQDYINSQGIYLKELDNREMTYAYLTNRKTMKALLQHNRLDPMNLKSSWHGYYIRNYEENHLYPLYIGIGNNATTGRQFTKTTGADAGFGHDLLMYKTNYDGLDDFIPHLGLAESTDINTHLYIDLLAQLEELETIDNVNKRNNGIVCIMIDFCNKAFYVVNELDSPNTLGFFDDDGNFYGDEEEYNRLWRAKLVATWCNGFQSTKYINFTDSTGTNKHIDLGTITVADLNLFIPDSDLQPSKFYNYFVIQSYAIPQVSGGNVLPDTYPRDQYLGALNMECIVTPGGVASCREPYYCHQDFQVNNASYNVCKNYGDLNSNCHTEDDLDEAEVCNGSSLFCNLDWICNEKGALDTPARMNRPHCDNNLYRECCGEDDELCAWYGDPRRCNYFCKSKGVLDTPCRDSEPFCDDDLYCDDTDICEQKGELNTLCRDDPPQCNNDDLYCNYNDRCKEKAFSRIMRTCATYFI